jgi:hypothetical protein
MSTTSILLMHVYHEMFGREWTTADTVYVYPSGRSKGRKSLENRTEDDRIHTKQCMKDVKAAAVLGSDAYAVAKVEMKHLPVHFVMHPGYVAYTGAGSWYTTLLCIAIGSAVADAAGPHYSAAFQKQTNKCRISAEVAQDEHKREIRNVRQRSARSRLVARGGKVTKDAITHELRAMRKGCPGKGEIFLEVCEC